jgi:hypothetical protein
MKMLEKAVEIDGGEQMDQAIRRNSESAAGNGLKCQLGGKEWGWFRALSKCVRRSYAY